MSLCSSQEAKQFTKEVLAFSDGGSQGNVIVGWPPRGEGGIGFMHLVRLQRGFNIAMSKRGGDESGGDRGARGAPNGRGENS